MHLGAWSGGLEGRLRPSSSSVQGQIWLMEGAGGAERNSRQSALLLCSEAVVGEWCLCRGAQAPVQWAELPGLACCHPSGRGALTVHPYRQQDLCLHWFAVINS